MNRFPQWVFTQKHRRILGDLFDSADGHCLKMTPWHGQVIRWLGEKSFDGTKAMFEKVSYRLKITMSNLRGYKRNKSSSPPLRYMALQPLLNKVKVAALGLGQGGLRR